MNQLQQNVTPSTWLGSSDLPFPDCANSFDNVFEQVAIRPEKSLVASQSSYFVLTLLEFCCQLEDTVRDDLRTRVVENKQVFFPAT